MRKKYRRLLVFGLIALSAFFLSAAKPYFSHEFFSYYNVSNCSNYVYDENGNTGITYGQVNVRDHRWKTIQIGVPILGSSSVTVQVEGRTSAGVSWAQVMVKTFAAGTGIDHLYDVTMPQLDWIRVGIKCNGTDGVDAVDVYGAFGSDH